MVPTQTTPVGRDGELTRLVERLSIVRAPEDFRALCERVVPTGTRFIVLDLDRTLHLGRNMGELLGWEICAHASYGDEYLGALEPTRPAGRIYLERSRLRGSLRYMRHALSAWAPSGLFYLLWGKIAARSSWMRRHSFLRFGVEPVRAVQSIPQHALMHRIAGLPLATVRELAARVWKRYRADQTIEREDIAWLREHCPGVKIIISSASPQPTLEIAARELGVDDIVYSSVEEHEGRLSAPCDLRRLARPAANPHRISPPSRCRINAGRAKLDELFARYPELREPGVVSVGITDTGYGEDHSWSEAFTVVVDVNSSSPFPPVVVAGATVRSIVSAGVLTRREKDAREAGDAGFVDPRRGVPGGEAGRGSERVLLRDELAARLGAVHAGIERLARQLRDETGRLAGAREVHVREAQRTEAALEDAVAGFNAAEGLARIGARREIAGLLRLREATARRLAQLERPLSELAFSLTRELERSRTLLDVA